MALDLTVIPAETKTQLIAAGKNFGSNETLAQAQKTLKAYKAHGSKLADYGFNSDDAERLRDAADELVASGVGRDQKKTGKKETNRIYLDTMRDGRHVRLQARAVLGSVRRVASETVGPEALQVVQTVDTVLSKGTVAEEEANALAGQLDNLRLVLDDKGPIEALASTRGGPKAVQELADKAGALRAIAEAAAGPRGTPAETDRLDLIDGIILALVRSGREAADIASKILGEPSLVTEFALTELYGSGSGEAKKEETQSTDTSSDINKPKDPDKSGGEGEG